MVVKTFRGKLADDGQDRIRLSTIKGKVGYRIIKFQLMTQDPNENTETAVKIYKKKQTTIDEDVNFTDSDLLAAAMYWSSTNQASVHESIIIFDRETFNQDIYVTCADVAGAAPMNYYLELEVIPLDDAGAEYTTLKDMRSA